MIDSIKALTKTRGFKLVASFIITLALITPAVTNAQLSPADPEGNLGLPTGTQQGEIIESIEVVIYYALGFVGIIAVVFLIIGGFRYITSQGSSDQVESAKSTILYALLGIVVIGISVILVNVVVNIIKSAGA